MIKSNQRKKHKFALKGLLLMIVMTLSLGMSGGLNTSKVQAKEDALLPPSPYIYQTGKDWVMLAWEDVDSENPQSADHYLIYQDDALNSLNANNPVPVSQKHFLITGLKPDTEYCFWFAGMKGSIISEKASPIEVKTLSDTNITVNGLNDQWGKIGDTLTFRTQLQGMEVDDTAEFIWQMTDGDWKNIWSDIPNSNSDHYSVLIENDQNNRKRYRVKVNIKKMGPDGKEIVKDTLYSKVATLYVIEPDKKPPISVMLELEDANTNAPLPEYNGVYYTMTKTKINIIANATYSTGDPMNGVVAFQYVNDNRTIVIGEGTLDSGRYVKPDFKLNDSGTYKFGAVIAPPSGDTPGSMSPLVVVHVGLENSDYYKIDYQMNGGTIKEKNPAAIRDLVQPIILKYPTKAYATFDGWYSDEMFTNKNKITVLDTNILVALDNGNQHITLYAKWENNTYPIHYELNGGSNHPDNPDTYTAYETIVLKKPRRMRYNFQGWYIDKNYEKPINSLPILNEDGEPDPQENITLYARWSLQENQNTDDLDIVDNKTNPKTNDTSHVFLWINLSLISAFIIITNLNGKRKNRKHI